MSEYGTLTGASKKNESLAEGTEQRIGGKWVLRILWGLAIVAAVLLVSGTIAAIFFCN